MCIAVRTAFLSQHLYNTDEEADNAYGNIHDATLMSISNMRQSLGLNTSWSKEHWDVFDISYMLVTAEYEEIRSR